MAPPWPQGSRSQDKRSQAESGTQCRATPEKQISPFSPPRYPARTNHILFARNIISPAAECHVDVTLHILTLPDFNTKINPIEDTMALQLASRRASVIANGFVSISAVLKIGSKICRRNATAMAVPTQTLSHEVRENILVGIAST